MERPDGLNVTAGGPKRVGTVVKSGDVKHPTAFHSSLYHHGLRLRPFCFCLVSSCFPTSMKLSLLDFDTP